MSWLLLAGAILTEVAATLSLRVAAADRPRWYAGVAIGYVTSFVLLGATLNSGMPLGIAYGIWSAVGVALTAVLARVLFKEPLTSMMLLGVGLIMLGVLAIELGASH